MDPLETFARIGPFFIRFEVSLRVESKSVEQQETLFSRLHSFEEEEGSGEGRILRSLAADPCRGIYSPPPLPTHAPLFICKPAEQEF